MPREEADVSQHELSSKKGKQTYTKQLEIMLIQLNKKSELHSIQYFEAWSVWSLKTLESWGITEDLLLSLFVEEKKAFLMKELERL